MKFFWTDEAYSSFQQIKKSIRKRFTEKEVENFVIEMTKTLKAIDKFPKAFPVTKIRRFKSTRKAVIHPHSTVFYRIKNKNEITIILFLDNRDNPSKIK